MRFSCREKGETNNNNDNGGTRNDPLYILKNKLLELSNKTQEERATRTKLIERDFTAIKRIFEEHVRLTLSKLNTSLESGGSTMEEGTQEQNSSATDGNLEDHISGDINAIKMDSDSSVRLLPKPGGATIHMECNSKVGTSISETGIREFPSSDLAGDAILKTDPSSNGLDKAMEVTFPNSFDIESNSYISREATKDPNALLFRKTENNHNFSI